MFGVERALKSPLYYYPFSHLFCTTLKVIKIFRLMLHKCEMKLMHSYILIYSISRESRVSQKRNSVYNLFNASTTCLLIEQFVNVLRTRFSFRNNLNISTHNCFVPPFVKALCICKQDFHGYILIQNSAHFRFIGLFIYLFYLVTHETQLK